jgi:hypothetical protein
VSKFGIASIVLWRTGAQTRTAVAALGKGVDVFPVPQEPDCVPEQGTAGSGGRSVHQDVVLRLEQVAQIAVGHDLSMVEGVPVSVFREPVPDEVRMVEVLAQDQRGSLPITTERFDALQAVGLREQGVDVLVPVEPEFGEL